MKHLLTVCAIILFTILFIASSSTTHYNYSAATYAEIDRPLVRDTSILIRSAKIIPLSETPQTQTKGGVSISCEVVPIITEKSITKSETYVNADPYKPEYDVKRIASIPSYILNPDVVTLKVTINNNQKRVLKLRDCAVVLIIDNIQFSLPQESITQWENTNVVSGFSSAIFLQGPNLNMLSNTKSINVFINDVPISYDKAGSPTEVENFEWFFSCSPTTEVLKDKIEFSYIETPVYSEQCPVCKGLGELEHTQTCTRCGGDGKYVNKYDGKTYSCTRCNQTGTEHIKETCYKCSGKGALSYPKSTLPPTSSETRYTGWDVNVVTTPPGAEVWVFRSNEGKYVKDGLSPITVPWVKSDINNYPIIVKANGIETKVLPYSSSGKTLTSIKIDTRESPHIIEMGLYVK